MKLSLLCLLTAAISWPLFAAESGTVLKTDQLRADAFNDAAVVGSVNKNDAVEILNKKGAWLQIKTSKQSGWVRLLTVKRNGSGGSDVAGAVNVATGRNGTGKVVSTTGIRGLSAEELKTAKFNEAETKKMESFAVTAVDAKAYASSGGLSSRSYAYFSTGAQ